VTAIAARQLGRLLLWIALGAFIVGAALFVLAGVVATWPLRRQPRRRAQLRAVMELGVAAAAAAAVFRDSATPATGDGEQLGATGDREAYATATAVSRDTTS
jgi:H+/gluconate symporter-like permease